MAAFGQRFDGQMTLDLDVVGALTPWGDRECGWGNQYDDECGCAAHYYKTQVMPPLRWDDKLPRSRNWYD